MQGQTKFDYETFLKHKSELIATFEVALMDACEKFEQRHGTIAQLEWFSNPDKYARATSHSVVTE